QAGPTGRSSDPHVPRDVIMNEQDPLSQQTLVLIEGEPTFSCRHSLIDVDVDKEEFPMFRAPSATWRERINWALYPLAALTVAAFVDRLV
ncbi:hypothetical protein, partial [Streptomyces sp. NPDC088789]|uniref:hypothetical protein n=1 Tax=Streptomyces sp. NPDC088789 TaxID=3365899 RepID=UPI0037FCA8AC